MLTLYYYGDRKVSLLKCWIQIFDESHFDVLARTIRILMPTYFAVYVQIVNMLNFNVTSIEMCFVHLSQLRNVRIV